MYLYLVFRQPHSPARPGELYRIVVIAADDAAARDIAAREHGTERPDLWLTSHAQVERLGVPDNPHYPNRVVCRGVRTS